MSIEDATPATSEEVVVPTTDTTPLEEVIEEVAAPQETEVEATPPPVEDEPVSENLSKLEDGSFRYVVDPTDPRSTVYTGKTQGELWANVTNGIKAKDTYIQQLKAEKVSRVTAPEKSPVETQPQVEFPEEMEIVTRLAKQRGLDPSMATWGDQEWRNYELDNGAYTTMKHAKAVDDIKAQALSEYNTKTAYALNHQVLTTEMGAISELCSAFHVDVDAVDWKAIQEKMQKEPAKYYLANGLIAPGAFTREAILSIRAVAEKQSKETITKKIAEETVKNKALKTQAANTTVHSKHVVKDITQEVYDSLEAVNADLKKRARNGEFD